MKFWAIDSPVMRVLGRLGDIIILNMIFVVGCIPVITIGTSLSALYAKVCTVLCVLYLQ